MALAAATLLVIYVLLKLSRIYLFIQCFNLSFILSIKLSFFLLLFHSSFYNLLHSLLIHFMNLFINFLFYIDSFIYDSYFFTHSSIHLMKHSIIFIHVLFNHSHHTSFLFNHLQFSLSLIRSLLWCHYLILYLHFFIEFFFISFYSFILALFFFTQLFSLYRFPNSSHISFSSITLLPL